MFPINVKNDLFARREFIAFIIYLSLLLDNVLLTVIVPILPEYLAEIGSQNLNSSLIIPNSVLYNNFKLHYVSSVLTDNFNTTVSQPIQKKMNNYENGSIGMLLATKALVQLIFNPIIGSISTKIGYHIPIVFGTSNLMISTLVFAFGNSYWSLLMARSIQGIGSSCISVSGMSLIAQLYPEEEKRSKIMGIILGSVALGVLIGYPFGGISYDFIGKAAPFYILSIFLAINLFFQLSMMDLEIEISNNDHIDTESGEIMSQSSKWWQLFSDKLVLLVLGAICTSTSAMSILEPCLPVWLLENLQPKKWQLGTAFIPDSVGYLIGTNFFGQVAYKMGQVNISVVSLSLVGISCILIPLAKSVSGLLLPHFGLGLGIGVLDAALVPLLASLVDLKFPIQEDEYLPMQQSSNYGIVYALQQIAVSLAYSIAPLISSEFMKSYGFKTLMYTVGIINLLYGPLLFYTTIKYRVQAIKEKDILLQHYENAEEKNKTSSGSYKRFYNTID